MIGLVGLLVLDFGASLDRPPAQTALGCADQLVLACGDESDTACMVAEAAGWLRRIPPRQTRTYAAAPRLGLPRRGGDRPSREVLPSSPRDENAAVGPGRPPLLMESGIGAMADRGSESATSVSDLV